MSDIEDLEDLRGEVLKLRAILHTKGAPAGTRKRAAKALGDLAVAVCDTALAALRARETAAPHDVEMVP